MGLGITRPYKYVIVICEYLSNFFAFKTDVTFFFLFFSGLLIHNFVGLHNSRIG